MRKLIYSLCLLITSFAAHAQQDAQFTQYMFNPLYWNPATAGNDIEYNELTVIHRSQWLGYSGTFDDGSAPTTQSVTFSMPFPRKESKEGGNHWGLGLSMVHDQTGLFRNVEAQLGIAYHHEIKSLGKLSFGVSSGLYNQSIDGSKLRFVVPGDPLDPGDQTVSDMKADLSAGVYLNTARYFAGIGASGLLGSEFAFNATDQLSASSLAVHMNFIGGYNIDVNSNWKVTPSTIVKFAEKDNISYEVSLLATYNDGEDKFYGGLAYRDSEGPSALLGIYLGEHRRIRLGYAFDLVVQGQNAKERTSHEIMLTYRMDPFIIKVPGQIHTPRFKQY